MKKLSFQNTKPVTLVGYIIFCSCVVALFFTNRLEARNAIFWQHIPMWKYANLTVRNMVLFVMNASMTGIVFAPLANEDERVKTIRSYAAKHAFRVSIAQAILMGILLRPGLNLLVFAIIMQVFYLILFRICLYRDSAIVYLDEEQVKDYYKSKKVRKQFLIFNLVISFLFAGLPACFALYYNRPELAIVGIIVTLGISALAQVFYTHWKK